METVIGRIIDTYKIVDVLGKGGMGIVYKAIDMTLDRDVALKMMDAKIESEPNFLRRFQSEAKALAKLQNPNIVAIFALRETELGYCIVMEYVKGRTLAELIRQKGALPLSRTLNIFKQLLNALGHAHKAGVIHRDIKPSNVLLTDDDFVKVTDFGLAKIQQAAGVTVTMGTGGTLYYMSPEQLRGLANVDQRGDIYSTGMSLYESLTGRVPFKDPEADFDIRQAIVDGKIPPPDKMNPTLPKELVKVVMKSLDKDPERRYQSAGEMWSALERFAVATNIPTLATSEENTVLVGTQTVKPPPPPRKKTALYVGGVVGLIVAVAIVLRLAVFTPTTMLTVRTEPEGASVFVNGTHVGPSPVTLDKLKPGRFEVSVRKPNFVGRDTAVNLLEGSSLALNISLPNVPVQKAVEPTEQHATEEKPPETHEVATHNVVKTPENVVKAKLILRAVPSGTISVEGSPEQFSAGAPVQISVNPGTRRILFKSSAATKTERVTLKPGETRELTCYFEGYVNLNSHLQGTETPLWGTVVIDGKVTDFTTPKEGLTLKPGAHTITVTRQGYTTVEGTKKIVVEPSLHREVQKLVFQLKKQQ
jgi:serine/threonine protein kinase